MDQRSEEQNMKCDLCKGKGRYYIYSFLVGQPGHWEICHCSAEQPQACRKKDTGEMSPLKMSVANILTARWDFACMRRQFEVPEYMQELIDSKIRLKDSSSAHFRLGHLRISIPKFAQFVNVAPDNPHTQLFVDYDRNREGIDVQELYGCTGHDHTLLPNGFHYTCITLVGARTSYIIHQNRESIHHVGYVAREKKGDVHRRRIDGHAYYTKQYRIDTETKHVETTNSQKSATQG